MTDDHGTRLVVVETQLAQMQAGINDLTKAVRALADQPRQPPFKEIAATVAVCLGIVAYVGGYLEGQFKKSTAVTEYRIEQLEKRLSK